MKRLLCFYSARILKTPAETKDFTAQSQQAMRVPFLTVSVLLMFSFLFFLSHCTEKPLEMRQLRLQSWLTLIDPFFPRYGRNDEIVAQTSSNLHWKQNLKQTFQYRTILPIVRRNNNLTDTQKYRRIAAGRARCAVQTYQDTTFRERERERKKVCHIDKLNFLVFR